MSGEAAFNQEMYEVVQEIIRQLMLHDGTSFDYKFQSKLGITPLEQLKILRLLSSKQVVKLKQHVKPGIKWDDDDIRAIYNDRFEVVTTKKRLEKYAANLNVSEKEHQLANNQMVTCTLRLHDRDMMLKIGKYPEKQIGRLQEDRPLHKLMGALSSRSPGVDVRSADVLPNVDNLWQLFGKSNFGYLAPFFKHTNRRMAFYPTIELSKNQVISMISKVTEKYRKNLDSIADSL